jgi:hypothetical protein
MPTLAWTGEPAARLDAAAGKWQRLSNAQH